MAWPSSPTANQNGFSSGSDTTIANGSALSVTAGGLIFVAFSWEGADTTLTVADGGVNTYTEVSFTGGHPGGGATPSEPWNACFWAVAATTTTLTITGTYGAARTFRAITALFFNPDAAGTISLDGTPTAAGGLGTSVATGNITTSTQDTNCGLALTSYSEYGDNPTSEQINGSAADNITNNGNHEVWMSRYTSGFTGQGTATIGFNHWAAGITAFKIVAGGGGGTYNAIPVLEYYLSRRQTGVFH